MKTLLTLFLTLLTTSCMVGPDFSTPPAQVEQEWLECNAPHVACGAPFRSAWWSYFNDPLLNELIDVAETQNLTLQTACMQIVEARAELGIAFGEFFPQLQEAVGSATRFLLSKNAPNTFMGDLQYWDFIVGLQAAWELDFWGKFRRGIESAGEFYIASYANYQDVLVLLLADVASFYVTIRTIESRIGIVNENIALQTRSLEIVEARWRAGAVTELDLQQAKTLVFSTRSRLPILETELRAAKNALSVLLGITPDRVDSLLTTPGPIPTAPYSLAVGIPAELLCRRPDVRRALHLAASQSARIGIAISELLPRLSISGFIGFESSAGSALTASGKGGKLFKKDSLTYFFGPDFAWPILNYGRLTNRVRAERSRFYQTVLDYQNTILTAFSEVEDGLISFVKAHQEVDELEISVKAADRATELARIQYVEGIADYLRVLDTERAKLEEEDRLALAQGNIALSLILSYRALGGGWEPFCNKG